MLALKDELRFIQSTLLGPKPADTLSDGGRIDGDIRNVE